MARNKITIASQDLTKRSDGFNTVTKAQSEALRKKLKATEAKVSKSIKK